MLHRCCCSGWGCCCRCRRGRHSRCCCFLVISLAGNTPPKNSRPTVELIPLTRDAWRRRPLVTTAMDGMSDVATCPTCLKVFNKKRNLTRHQKHTLSCSGPRKQLERPQRSPCGGGGIDGHGGLGGDGGDGGGGDDDDTRPAAKLARLATTPAVVAPACCTKCSRSDQQRDLLFCDGRLCRKAFHCSCR